MRIPYRGLGVVALLGAATILAACGGGAQQSAPVPASAPKPAPPAPPPPPVEAPPPAEGATTTAGPSQAAIDEAAQIFMTRCTPCHGAEGKGDGIAAASLNPKPRNYQDAAWQATVPDAEIEKAILEGGTAVGKSPLMPPNPDLAGKPEVIQALRMKVRSFAPKAE